MRGARIAHVSGTKCRAGRARSHEGHMTGLRLDAGAQRKRENHDRGIGVGSSERLARKRANRRPRSFDCFSYALARLSRRGLDKSNRRENVSLVAEVRRGRRERSFADRARSEVAARKSSRPRGRRILRPTSYDGPSLSVHQAFEHSSTIVNLVSS